MMFKYTKGEHGIVVRSKKVYGFVECICGNTDLIDGGTEKTNGNKIRTLICENCGEVFHKLDDYIKED